MRCSALRIALVLVLLAGTVALRADERIAGAVVVIGVGPGSEGSDTVRRVVASSVEVYLRQVLLVPIDGGSWDGDDAARAVAERWADSDVDFLLLARLEAGESTIDVELSLYLHDTGQLLTRTRGTEAIGLTLDRAIAGLVASLVEQSRPYLRAAADERRVRLSEVAAADDPPEVPPGAPPEVPPMSGAGAIGEVRPGEPAGRGPAASAPDRHFMGVSSRYAPLVPVGTAAAYLGLGRGVGLRLDFFPLGTDWFAVGFAGRGVLAQATGAAARADLVLASAGIGVTFCATEGRVVPYLGVTAGASFFRATNETLGTFETVVPYGEAGLGVQVRLFGPFRLDVGVGFEAYLTESILLLGFAPGIGLAVRI